MINEVIQTKVNIAIMEKFRSALELKWTKLEKGLTNIKYVISSFNEKPIAICKIFPDSGVIKPEQRFEREKEALEIFGGLIAPKLICGDNPNVLVYEYAEGKELINMRTNKDLTPLISETLSQLHASDVPLQPPTAEDVTNYYNGLIELYKNSEVSFPNKMLKELQDIVNSQVKILEQNQNKLTYIHGDLVPPNFIFRNDKVCLIDWEFFRPELEFFDIAYFNYYAKSHKIPFEIEIENQEIKDLYHRLVDVLEKLWHIEYDYYTENQQ